MSISDSTAAVDDDRVWPQHQAALTLLQDRIAQPKGGEIRWLDLACGRGQILRSLDEQLSEIARGRIHYVGYDISNRYALETKKRAEQLDVLRPTPTSVLQVSLASPTMPIVQCRVGAVVLPLYLDTGSSTSFGDEAAFVASGGVPRADESEYAVLSLSVGGRVSPVEARQADLDVAVISDQHSVSAVLRIMLVRDWENTPLASMAPLGFVGRSFLVDNDLSLTLVADEVVVTRGE